MMYHEIQTQVWIHYQYLLQLQEEHRRYNLEVLIKFAEEEIDLWKGFAEVS